MAGFQRSGHVDQRRGAFLGGIKRKLAGGILLRRHPTSPPARTTA